MENMITQEVDAIIVHRADSNGIMTGVRKAQDAGVLVLTIGTPAAEDTFLRTGVDYMSLAIPWPKQRRTSLAEKENSSFLKDRPGHQMQSRD